LSSAPIFLSLEAARPADPSLMAIPRIASAALIGSTLAFLPVKADQSFLWGDWRIECKSNRMTDKVDCLITLGLAQRQGPAGLFRVVVMTPAPPSGSVSIVGANPIAYGQLRVDKNPAVGCRGPQFCSFSAADSVAIEASSHTLPKFWSPSQPEALCTNIRKTPPATAPAWARCANGDMRRSK
jgi:hypothetical protein